MPFPKRCRIAALALLIGMLAGCGGGGGSPGINPTTANDPKAVLHGASGVGESVERPQQ